MPILDIQYFMTRMYYFLQLFEVQKISYIPNYFAPYLSSKQFSFVCFNVRRMLRFGELRGKLLSESTSNYWVIFVPVFKYQVGKTKHQLELRLFFCTSKLNVEKFLEQCRETLIFQSAFLIKYLKYFRQKVYYTTKERCSSFRKGQCSFFF